MPARRALITTLCVAALLVSLGLLRTPTGGAQEVPRFTGKGKVTDAIDGDKGAIFDIGGGVSMFFPVGLPVGSSRLVTLSKGKRPPPKAVHAGFKPAGPTLDFNGAFSTAGRPIVLSVAQKRSPEKAGHKLVLAMEVGTFCDDSNKMYKLKTGLCSGWELRDASYDGAAGQMVAKLDSTGGLRMQFGTVPEGSGEDE